MSYADLGTMPMMLVMVLVSCFFWG